MMSTNANDEPETPMQSREGFVKYQSTPERDVRTAIVEPSFDAEDASAGGQSVQLPKLGDDAATHERIEPTCIRSSHFSEHFFDGTDPSDELAGWGEGETRSGPAPTSSKETTHLAPASSIDDRSSSFNFARPSPHASEGDFPLQQSSGVPKSSSHRKTDARKIPSEQENARTRGPVRPAQSSTQPYRPPQSSHRDGKKHRRVFSGDEANPAVARRRINSGGERVDMNRKVSRGSYMPGFWQRPPSIHPSPTSANHRRRSGGHRGENSAGLGMLSAAASVSKGVLAETAAVQPPSSCSYGRRVDQFNLSPASFSSIGSASPSQCYSSNNWSNGLNLLPRSSRHNEMSNHPSQPPPHHPRFHEPHHRQSQQYYAPPPHSYYPVPIAFSGPPGSYPMQYAPGYHNGSQQLQSHHKAPGMSQHSPPPSRHNFRGSAGSSDKIDEDLFNCRGFVPPTPAGQSKEHEVASTGVQTFARSVNEGGENRIGRPSAAHRNANTPSTDISPIRSMQPPFSPQESGHHRKTSSFSSLGAFLGNSSLFPEAENASPCRQRWSSSTANCYEGGMEGFDTADRFLQQLSGSPTTRQVPGSKFSSPLPLSRQTQAPFPNVVSSEPSSGPGTGTRRYMMTGTSKRIRRKCNVADCTNRVVQGGVCISHGAKRKQCSHPGCTKHVKKAGLCSAHGPARKRCDHEDCKKVAVQGGRCISHGAKKKLCLVEGCSKQGILGGMCKRHHDQHNGISSSRVGGRSIKKGGFKERKAPAPQFCVSIDGHRKGSPEQERRRSTPGHRRGLSIFADMSAVDSIIGEGDPVPGESAASCGAVPPVSSMSFEERIEASPQYGKHPGKEQWHR